MCCYFNISAIVWRGIGHELSGAPRLKIPWGVSNTRQTVCTESAYSFQVSENGDSNGEVSYGSNCPHFCNDSHLDSCFLSSKAERLQTEIKSSWSGAGAFLDSINFAGSVVVRREARARAFYSTGWRYQVRHDTAGKADRCTNTMIIQFMGSEFAAPKKNGIAGA